MAACLWGDCSTVCADREVLKHHVRGHIDVVRPSKRRKVDEEEDKVDPAAMAVLAEQALEAIAGPSQSTASYRVHLPSELTGDTTGSTFSHGAPTISSSLLQQTTDESAQLRPEEGESSQSQSQSQSQGRQVDHTGDTTESTDESQQRRRAYNILSRPIFTSQLPPPIDPDQPPIEPAISRAPLAHTRQQSFVGFDDASEEDDWGGPLEYGSGGTRIDQIKYGRSLGRSPSLPSDVPQSTQ